MILIVLQLWAPAAGAAYDNVTEFQPSYAGPIVAGSDGNMWMGGVDRVTRITPKGEMTEFPTPTSQLPVWDMALGADGNVWIVQSDLAVEGVVGTVARVTPGGQVTEFPLPARETWPLSIAAGPGERLAFSDGGHVGWVDMHGAITRFDLPPGSGKARAVAYDRAGNIWFTEMGGKIGRLTPDGAIAQYPIPGGGNEAGFIALGADGNLWFTIPDKVAIGRITTGGKIKVLPVLQPKDSESRVAPWAIAPGPDGRLWFTESQTRLLGWVNPFHQAIGRLQLSPPSETHPGSVAAGPEGDLWYSGQTGSFEGGSTQLMGHSPRVGRISLESLTARLGEVHPTRGNRRLRTEIACRGGRANNVCRGRLQVLAKLNGGGPHAHGWTVLARGRYAVPTDSRGKVTFPLSDEKRALISHLHPWLRVRAVVPGRNH